MDTNFPSLRSRNREEIDFTLMIEWPILYTPLYFSISILLDFSSFIGVSLIDFTVFIMSEQ